MLADIGGVRSQPEHVTGFTSELLHYPNREAAHDDLMRMASVQREGYLGMSDLTLPRSDFPEFYCPHELAPPFIRALRRRTTMGLKEANWTLAEQVLRERRQMLAWYLGLCSLMTPDEVESLVTRVEEPGY